MSLTPDSRLRTLIRCGAALVCLALVAAPALRPDTYLSRRDIARLHLPLREFVAAEWREGRVPTWNHLDGLGVSLEGTAIAAPLHPAQLLLLVAPPDVALKLQVLGLLLLAGWGAALLARRQGGPEPSWWLAALAYAGSGYLVSVTDNFTYLHGAALLPWAVLAAERLAEAPSAARALALGALLALGLYGGDVQGTLLACLLASAWALGRGRFRLPVWGALAFAGLVTLLLSAPLLAAIAATAVDSGRAAGLSARDIFQWSLSPVRLLELPFGPLVLVETLDFHGALFARPLGGQTGALWATSEFVGVAVLALAPLGLGRLEGRRGWPWAALAGVTLLLALGASGGLYALLLAVVPGWGAFRYPEKFMPFVALGLALLAARGASSPVRRAHLVSFGLWALLAAVLATSVDGELVQRAFVALRTTSDELPLELAEQVASALRASGTVALVCALLGAAAAWRAPKRLGWVAVAALALQVTWCARGLIATQPREALAQRPVLLEPVQAAGERARLAAWPERYSFRGKRFAATEAAALGDFEALSPNHNMRFGVGNIASYSPGTMGELEQACSLRPLCTSLCARRLGARLCIVPPEQVAPMTARGAQELARLDQPVLLSLLKDAQAREWASVPGARPLREGEALRDALKAEGETVRALVRGLEVERPAEPGAVTRWSRARPDEAEVELTLQQDNVLVVAEHCARGWRASIDGQPEVTPLRADGGLCAVPVPAGAHVVKLRYVPPGWPVAWGFFGAGVLLAGLVLALRIRSVRACRGQADQAST